MAKLDDHLRIYCSGCHTDRFIVVADQCKKFIAGVFQLREELEQCLVVLRGSQHTDRNVMREVIDAVDERNLPIISFYGHEFAINDEEAAEPLGITVRKSHLVVVWQSFQFCRDAPVGCICSFPDVSGHRADARALEM